MAVFTLTDNTDLFLAVGNDVDHFVGVPLTIEGILYDGATGGSDVLDGDGGDDHFYLGHGASGTYTGGGGIDTIHAYGNVGFFSTLNTVETFDAASTDALVGIAASHLNAFNTLTGFIRSDGRIHLSVGINASVDFGLKMSGGAAGIDVFVDSSTSGTFALEGTSSSDRFQVDKTNSNAVITYSGMGGNDWFVSDIDGGLAKFLGGAGNDTFVVTENFSFNGQFTEIDGGEETGDDDTIVSTGGDFTAKTLAGIETLKGTFNVLTPNQAAAIDNYTGETEDPPVVFLNDPVSIKWAAFFAGKAVDGLVLNTTQLAGGGEFGLTDKDDTFIGNVNAEETVDGLGGKDTFNVVWSTGSPAAKDVINAGDGNDVVVVTSNLKAGEKPTTELNGGAGNKDTLALAGETSRIVGAIMKDFEYLEVASANGLAIAQITQVIAFLFLDEPDAAPGSKVAQGHHITLVLEGAGGKLDVTTKAEGLNAGTGVYIDASATTSAVNLTGSTRNDKLTGSAKNDVLVGGKGLDTIVGGAGKDKIDGKAGVDTADYSDKTKAISVKLDGASDATVTVKNKAEDTLKNVENVTGGTKADKLAGDSNANGFDGGLGKDNLTGGGGKDKFVFSTALSAANVDTVTDFKSGQDKLVLDSAIFAAIGIKLDKVEFYSKDGAKAAQEADDRIVYDSKSGKLYYDADGLGGVAAVQFATLSGDPALSFKDFAIV